MLHSLYPNAFMVKEATENKQAVLHPQQAAAGGLTACNGICAFIDTGFSAPLASKAREPALVCTLHSSCHGQRNESSVLPSFWALP